MVQKARLASPVLVVPVLVLATLVLVLLILLHGASGARVVDTSACAAGVGCGVDTIGAVGAKVGCILELLLLV